MACLNCQKDVFTIRGLCEGCAPELHNEKRAWLRTAGILADAFERETGTPPLKDWNGFEKWLKSQSEIKEQNVNNEF